MIESNTPQSKKINGLKIFGFLSKQQFINYVSGKKIILISAGAESIVKQDERFNFIAEEHLAYPDGVGAVLALKQKGIDTIKIPGVEIWLQILEQSVGKKIYLFGSSDEVIEHTARKIRCTFKNVELLGWRSGYFNSDELYEIKKEIVNLKPDIVCLALGQPTQEYLAEELYLLHPAMYLCLGGSFDVFSGSKKRAPRFLIKLRLEWLYRLLKEPSRVFRQSSLLKFMYLLFFRKL